MPDQGSHRPPMRRRDILYPADPHGIVDMAEFVNVRSCAGDGEGEVCLKRGQSLVQFAYMALRAAHAANVTAKEARND